MSFIPMELVDSGNFTMSAENAVGGVSAEISPPHIAITAAQRTVDLMSATVGPVAKGSFTSGNDTKMPSLEQSDEFCALFGRKRCTVDGVLLCAAVLL